MKTNITTYKQTDKDDVIEIFNSNCPKYFDCTDQKDLIDFLENHADSNFKIVRHKNKTIGCGGHYIKHEENVFGIAWVMFRRHSLGRANFTAVSDDFFNYLLTSIMNENLDYKIVINTTQLLQKTFNKYGFITEKIIENGFGNNLDHYVMTRKCQH